jgi:hypothetical protein
MSLKDTCISDFLHGAEKLLRQLANHFSLVLGNHVLTPEQGTDGGGFVLHGQLGSNWIVLLIWGRSPWLEIEQCHVWWYVDDKPILPLSASDSPFKAFSPEPALQGIRPQFKRVIRGLEELETATRPYAEWIASALIDQILVDALAGAWPRARDASFIPITADSALADVRTVLADEPPQEEGDFV